MLSYIVNWALKKIKHLLEKEKNKDIKANQNSKERLSRQLNLKYKDLFGFLMMNLILA